MYSVPNRINNVFNTWMIIIFTSPYNRTEILSPVKCNLYSVTLCDTLFDLNNFRLLFCHHVSSFMIVILLLVSNCTLTRMVSIFSIMNFLFAVKWWPPIYFYLLIQLFTTFVLQCDLMCSHSPTRKHIAISSWDYFLIYIPPQAIPLFIFCIFVEHFIWLL